MLLLGLNAAETDDPDSAEGYYHQAIDLARQQDYDEALIRGLHNLVAGVYIPRGQFDLALAVDEDAYRLAMARQMPERAWSALASRGWVYWRRGQFPQAQEMATALKPLAAPGSLARGFHDCLLADLALEERDAAGMLYAAGTFDDLGSLTVHNIARWDGHVWSPLGAGVDGSIYALAFDQQGDLYVAGAFTHAGGAPANRIARWDGRQWQSLGGGVAFVSDSVYPATVSALAVDSQGVLYAGGLFNRAGGQPANYIARWDGSAWSALGEGMDGPATQWFNWVYALVLLDDAQLFAGGHFDTAGGISSRNIALWSQRIPLYMPLIMVTR